MDENELVKKIALMEKEVRKNERKLEKWKIQKANVAAQASPAVTKQPDETPQPSLGCVDTIPPLATNAVAAVDSPASNGRPLVTPNESNTNEPDSVDVSIRIEGKEGLGSAETSAQSPIPVPRKNVVGLPKSQPVSNRLKRHVPRKTINIGRPTTTERNSPAHSQSPVPKKKISVEPPMERKTSDRIQNRVPNKNVAISHAKEGKQSTDAQMPVCKENVVGNEKDVKQVPAQVPKNKIVLGRSATAGENNAQEKTGTEPLASKRYVNLKAIGPVPDVRRSARLGQSPRNPVPRTLPKSSRKSADVLGGKWDTVKRCPGQGNSAANKLNDIWPPLPVLGLESVEFSLPKDWPWTLDPDQIQTTPDLQDEITPDCISVITSTVRQMDIAAPEPSDRPSGSSDVGSRDESCERDKTKLESASGGDGGAACVEMDGKPSLRLGCLNEVGPVEAVHCCEVEGNRVVVVAQRRLISFWVITSTDEGDDKGRLVKQIAFALAENSMWRCDGFSTATDVGMLVAQHTGQEAILEFHSYHLSDNTLNSVVNNEASLCKELCEILSCRLETHNIIYAYVDKGFSYMRKYAVRRSLVMPKLTFNEVADSLNSLLKVDNLENAVIGFSKDRVYIWNHISGDLVKVMPICDGIQSGWFARSETGILFLGVVLSNQTDSNCLQLIASNPATSVCRKTSVAYAYPKELVRDPLTCTYEHRGRLVGITESGSIYTWNISTGVLVLNIYCRATSASLLKISPTRSLLAVGERPGHVRTYTLPF